KISRCRIKIRRSCPFAAVFWEAQISISALAGERLMDRHVARLNIEHYRKLIATEPDETKRQTLIRLQAEEELKLTASLRRYAGEMNRIAHSYFQNQPNGVTAHRSKAREFGWLLRPSTDEDP
ncbi:MAG: hypothetical protein WAK37_18260, partial [Pseudolabrys sp.]